MYEDYNEDVEQLVAADEGSIEGVTEAVADPQAEQSNSKEYNFRALEAERDRLRQEADVARESVAEKERLINVYRNMGYPQAQPAQGYSPVSQQPAHTQPPQTTGLDFGDAIDKDALGKLSGYFSEQAQQITQASKAQAEQMEQLELKMRDASWRDTINKYLPKAMERDPSIAETIKASPKAWTAAYHFATSNMDYLQSKMEEQQANTAAADRMIQNAEKPKTLGSVGVQSTVGGSRDAFSLSPDEFAEAKRRLISTGKY